MNKKEIAECIFKTQPFDLKRYEAYSFVDLLIEVVVERLSQDEKVVLSNFGTFKVMERKEKRVMNPNNNRAMIIPARKIVKFLPSKNLKDLIMEG